MSTKVLMFGWEFPPHNSGGLGVACLGLTKALRAQGVEIVFVLPKRVSVKNDWLSFHFADDRQKISFEEIDTPLYPYLTSEAYEDLQKNNLQFINYGPTLVEEVRAYGQRASRVAKQHQHHLIHAHDWLSFPAGLEAKRASGKPLIVHVHATEFDRTGGHGVDERVYQLEKEGMEGSDGIVVVSQRTKDMIVQHYGIDPTKIRVIHNGADFPDQQTSPKILQELKNQGNGIVVFVGRITLQKGPDYFVRLAKRVLEIRPNTYFIVAGSGDMERQMIRQVATLGIGDKVLFAGFVRGLELEAVYRVADVFIMPSISEPFGLTALEAMMSRTSVIVSKQSGVAEVINHALKVDFWDIDEMADQTIAILDQPVLAQALAHNGEQEVKQINWISAAGKCVNYYQEIINSCC